MMTKNSKNTVLDSLTEQQKNDLNYLLELAEQYEKKDLANAEAIMLFAQEKRPNAPKVKKKLALYQEMKQKKAAALSKKQAKGATIPRAHAQTPEKRKFSFDFKNWLKAPIVYCTLLPWLVFAFYTVFIETPKFESQAQIIVKQPDGASTMDASMALLSGFTGQSTSSDPQLVKAYIHSQDMLNYIESQLKLFEHVSSGDVDVFSRLSSDASREDFVEYYLKMVDIYIDDASSVITVKVKGFDANYTQSLTQVIVERSEWYINSIGHHLANEQLKFVQGEHNLVEQKLSQSQTELLQFQQEHNLIDPLAEGAAMQQIAYGLEGQIAAKEAELKTLLAVMSSNAPQVMATKSALEGLKLQLVAERSRLATTKNNMSVSEILAKFTDLKVNLDLALQAYTASQISLEKSRIEAYRQLKYLIVVEAPTLPEDATYPKEQYNLLLAAVLLLLVFGIGKIIIATIKELG
ncbi:lipopolysaccharide biosynthesis protein [Vibrio parahaemolyticus]|uniref:lipopolysaccharide biosynthesis protein n=1 Tax=Vibrio parahaemolyticus TaxID=670 RepID=UPI002269BDE4|nr:lipopolysaccharide biosynthesis protein [Vibrio parahaemolyticus]MCX8925365.1 lipopolysaccharide biosynthesis protein [Vibrio parahaemolyticus]